MKTKQLLAAAFAVVLATGCSQEEMISGNENISGKMMDASGFSLKASSEGALSRVTYTPTGLVTTPEGDLTFHKGAVAWELNDEIGFSHIYPTDQRLVTNYKFSLASGEGTTEGVFTTTNSTIFEGDYFAYYRFDSEYADYDGIPFEMEAVQTQNANAGAVVKVGTTDAAKLLAAGAHLPRFSITDRIKVEAKTTQTAFQLKQYTTYIGFILFPKNQTNTINVQRIEMVSTDGSSLDIPTKVLFNADGDKAKAEVKKTAEKAVLLLDNVGNNGLEIAKDATRATATLAYLGMLPGTYTAGTFKFVVYYTENGILKKRDIPQTKDLVLNSNQAVFKSLEIDAHGATEVVDFEIYTETEFASAVAKSNAITNGAATYTIMADIELKNNYTLSSDVPVTFNGDKKITLKGTTLNFESPAEININNVISAEGSGVCEVKKGVVNVKAVDSKVLNFRVWTPAEATVENADKQGNLNSVDNAGVLKLENVALAGNMHTGLRGADAELDLKNATIAGDFSNAGGQFALENVNVATTFTNNTTSTTASTLKNVTALGNFTNTAGTLDVTGNNVFAYNATVTPIVINDFSNAGTINFTASTTEVGNVTSAAAINLAKGSDDEVTFTAQGTSALANGLVYVDKNATYNAVGDVTGLKGDGSETSNSTMILEGTLTTDGVVTLENEFKICGTILNKGNGSWTLDSYGVYKFNHAHLTAPEFKNQGEVIVKGVTNTAATVAMNKMAQDLYVADGGRLEWADIEHLTSLNAIVALSEKCWATDLHAVIGMSMSEDLSATDALQTWVSKNVIIELNGCGGNNDVVYNVTLGKNKINANNLTVITAANNGKNASFTVGSTLVLETEGYAVNATGDLNLKNLVGAFPEHSIDLYSAYCKNVIVDNQIDNDFIIYKGYYIHYSDAYTTKGYIAKTSYPNNIPQKK